MGHLTVPTKKAITLESASIDKSTFQPLEAVVERYKKLKTVGNAGAMAVKLAKESIFGEVLTKCTVYGARDKPGLPTDELTQLKQAMFNYSSSFGNHLCSSSLSGMPASLECSAVKTFATKFPLQVFKFNYYMYTDSIIM